MEIEEKRYTYRYPVPFQISVEWTDESGIIVSDGTTENIGLNGVLAYLPRLLPTVGSEVKLTVSHESTKVTVDASVLRVERNTAHPQVAFILTNSTKDWELDIWQQAEKVIANQKAEVYDDWFVS